VRVPDRFDLALVVRSHGWYDLAPWRWDEARRLLARPLELSSGRVVTVEATEQQGGLAVRLLATGRPSAAEAAEARAQLRRCLDLDRDLGPFRALASALEERRAAGELPGLPDLRWALDRGAGRLLRSPTAWEDAVKTLCTTNCSWALTRAMVARLCDTLGPEGPGGERGFPGPEAMARRPASFYRARIRAGYRAESLAALARAVARGRLDLAALEAPALPVDEARERLLALRGFGPYAADHLLRLLGHHHRLALDSWNREKLRRLRGRRRAPSDRAIARRYAPYGAWAGLAFWLEVTADWFGPRADGAHRPW